MANRVSPPAWLNELVDAFDAPVEQLEASPETLRRACRLARLIDRDPDLPAGKVRLFLDEFDRLLAQKVDHLQQRADSAVIWRLRARAAAGSEDRLA